MAQIDPDDFLDQYTRPTAAVKPAIGKQDPDDFLSAYVPGQAANAAANPAPVATPGTLKYLAGKFATGALNTGNLLMAGMPQEAGLPPDQFTRPADHPDVAMPTPGDVNQLIFGAQQVQAPNTAARYGGAVAQEFGSNPMSFVPAFIAPTIGGAVGGEAMSGLFPGSGLLGSVLGGFGAGGLQNIATRGVNALTGNLNPVGQTFATAGVPMRSAALTSENPSTARLLAPSAPISQTESDLGNAVEQTAAALGPARTLQEAGIFAKARAQDWLDNVMPGKQAAAWAPIADNILPTTPAPMTNTMATIRALNSESGGLKPLMDLITPSLPKRMLDVLDNGDKSNAVIPKPPSVQAVNPPSPVSNAINPPIGFGGVSPTALQAIGRPGLANYTPTIGELQQFRSALGDAMSNPQVVKDIPAQQLSRLYASATSDLRSTIGNTNPDLVPLFDSANVESSRLYALAEGPIGKIISAETPEAAASGLLAPGKLKSGGTNLSGVRSELPDVVDALGAAHLRTNGLEDGIDATSGINSKFPGRWNTMAPEAKQALVGPDAAQRLDAIADIGQKLKSSPVAPGGKTMEALLGGTGGAALGTLGAFGVNALHNFGGDSAHIGMLGAAAGELAGMLGPSIGRAGRNGVANSELLAALAAARGLGPTLRHYGALAGGNALLGGQ